MNPADFHFIRPYWLLALLPSTIMFIFLLRNKLHRGNWSVVCDEELLPFILQEKPIHQSRWPLPLAWLASLLAIIALAGPSWERLPAPVFRNEASLVIILDLSKSMDATDIKPSRLTRARYKIADILNHRDDGQTALMVYAGDAFTVTPLTEDTETIISQLPALKTDIIPVQGSNTVAAVRMATQLLKQAGQQQGDIVLISDGVNPDSIKGISELLGHYRLSVLAVGTVQGAPIKASAGGFIKDSQDNIVIARLDTTELARLAAAGHGIYQTITPDDSDTAKILSAMDAVISDQKSSDPQLYLQQWDDKGPWLLLLILPLAALAFRKGLLSVLLLILLPFHSTDSYALEWKDLWQTRNQQAQQAFKQKKFKQAAEQFESAEWKAAAQYRNGHYLKAAETLRHANHAEAYYNRGNALARAGKLQEAIASYTQALQLDPNHEDARFNKELLEKQNKQQSSKQNEDSQKSREDDQKKGSPEQSSGQNPDQQEQKREQKKADQTGEQEKADQKKPEHSPQQQTEPSANPIEHDENRQASEQWLKRIPDNPAGLLKRKFRYQYRKRGSHNQQDQTW